MADFTANDLSLDGDDKPLFDTLTFEQSQIDDMSVESASLQTPTLMEIVTAAPFSSQSTQSSDNVLADQAFFSVR
ncbi:hypothetical protein BDV09DRAFT_172176 [Aspergillus tetrazonus]